MTERAGEGATREGQRPTWKGRRGDRYVPVFGDFFGNPESGYHHEWSGLAEPHLSLQMAIVRGARKQDSDDFNVAVIRGEKVVAVLWMTEDMQEEQAVLDELTDALKGWWQA